MLLFLALHSQQVSESRHVRMGALGVGQEGGTARSSFGGVAERHGASEHLGSQAALGGFSLTFRSSNNQPVLKWEEFGPGSSSGAKISPPLPMCVSCVGGEGCCCKDLFPGPPLNLLSETAAAWARVSCFPVIVAADTDTLTLAVKCPYENSVPTLLGCQLPLRFPHCITRGLFFGGEAFFFLSYCY